MSYNRGLARIFVVLGLALSVSLLVPTGNSSWAKNKKTSGADVYQQYCASCHQSGGNLTVPGKPVADSKKLSTIAVFKDYLNNPVGHMPFYKNLIEDQTTLKALYDYCKTLRKENIKEISELPLSWDN